ncbi:hypothetical protein SBA4_1900024 [Candidatus Sulfopaludibacter sp. SbA4]|nr:hypothetical protein SBA4_1900024 [Candidatus Sulfopaludibacter sp. SbA4]
MLCRLSYPSIRPKESLTWDTLPLSHSGANLERSTGVQPVCSAWKADASRRSASPAYQLSLLIVKEHTDSLVGAGGFEPPIFCSQGRRLTGLAYTPKTWRRQKVRRKKRNGPNPFQDPGRFEIRK